MGSGGSQVEDPVTPTAECVQPLSSVPESGWLGVAAVSQRAPEGRGCALMHEPTTPAASDVTTLRGINVPIARHGGRFHAERKLEPVDMGTHKD